MKKESLIEELKLFKDKAFCHHSHYKASNLWRGINSNSFWKENPQYDKQRRQISIEWSHVQIGYGFEQACRALDDEVKKLIEMIDKG